MRVKGIVSGYISENLGIIEARDKHSNKVNILFSTEDVWIFKRPLRRFERDFNQPAGRLLPVGLMLSVDARRVRISGVDNLQYQAVAVLAGSWPSFPHPTLLPGGPGSWTRAYDVPDNMTFYYLELSLEAKLCKKINMLKEEVRRTRGDVVFMWRNVNTIRGGGDQDQWRGQFTSRPKIDQSSRNHEDQKHRHFKHTFKAPPPRMIKTKKEIDDCSSVATAGSSAGYLSDVSSMSRPQSRSSHVSSTCSSKSRRDWYNPDNWQHGGLRYEYEYTSYSSQLM